jgi:hypothetical protein
MHEKWIENPRYAIFRTQYIHIWINKGGLGEECYMSLKWQFCNLSRIMGGLRRFLGFFPSCFLSFQLFFVFLSIFPVSFFCVVFSFFFPAVFRGCLFLPSRFYFFLFLYFFLFYFFFPFLFFWFLFHFFFLVSFLFMFPFEHYFFCFIFSFFLFILLSLYSISFIFLISFLFIYLIFIFYNFLFLFHFYILSFFNIFPPLIFLLFEMRCNFVLVRTISCSGYKCLVWALITMFSNSCSDLLWHYICFCSR